MTRRFEIRQNPTCDKEWRLYDSEDKVFLGTVYSAEQFEIVDNLCKILNTNDALDKMAAEDEQLVMEMELHLERKGWKRLPHGFWEFSDYGVSFSGDLDFCYSLQQRWENDEANQPLGRIQ